MKNFCFLLIMIFIVSGCAMTPIALPLKEGMLTEFHTNNSIALVNNANKPDLKNWTNSVISFLSEQLEKRGAKMSPDSSRKLEIEITKVNQNGIYMYWAYKCDLILRVETGDGYVNEFNIHDVSGLSLQKACNFCVTKTVVEILNDLKIREYLGLTQ